MNDSVKQAIDAHIESKSLGRTAEFRYLFVPGRIEVLGKHTDYAGGSSIVAALSKGIGFAYRPRNDSHLHIHATDLKDSIELESDQAAVPPGHWSAYFQQVWQRLISNFPGPNSGATIIVASSLPTAAGMSSSSAIVIGAFLCLADLNDSLKHAAFKKNIKSRLELADYLSTVENGGSYRDLAGDTGVGTLGGSEDHTAILASRTSELGWFSYRPTKLRQYLKFPHDLTLAFISSGVVAEKSGGAREDYNRSARLCRELVNEWNIASGSDAANPGDLLQNFDFSISKMRKILTELNRDDLADRFQHFLLEETVHIPTFVSTLLSNDHLSMGATLFESFEDADRLLGNQIDETRALVEIARELGALGASAFGAGFGGSVYALVPTVNGDRFLSEWKGAYIQSFPQHAEMAQAFLDHPGSGVKLPDSLD